MNRAERRKNKKKHKVNVDYSTMYDIYGIFSNGDIVHGYSAIPQGMSIESAKSELLKKFTNKDKHIEKVHEFINGESAVIVLNFLNEWLKCPDVVLWDGSNESELDVAIKIIEKRRPVDALEII